MLPRSFRFCPSPFKPKPIKTHEAFIQALYLTRFFNPKPINSHKALSSVTKLFSIPFKEPGKLEPPAGNADGRESAIWRGKLLVVLEPLESTLGLKVFITLLGLKFHKF